MDSGRGAGPMTRSTRWLLDLSNAKIERVGQNHTMHDLIRKGEKGIGAISSANKKITQLTLQQNSIIYTEYIILMR